MGQPFEACTLMMRGKRITFLTFVVITIRGAADGKLATVSDLFALQFFSSDHLRSYWILPYAGQNVEIYQETTNTTHFTNKKIHVPRINLMFELSRPILSMSVRRAQNM